MKKGDSIKEDATADTGVTDQKKNEENKNTTPESDPSFQKHYNKELRVSQDEVPIVLNELNDSALKYIVREQYEKALVLFQKAHGIINVISLDHCRRDQHIAFVIFHNMAACYQRMNSLEECSVAIDNALLYLGDYNSLKNQSVCQRMVYMERECKVRMQLCALLSQLHRHREALDQAKQSIKLIHLLFKDLDALCTFFITKAFDEELEIIQEHLYQQNENLNDDYAAYFESMSKMMATSPQTAITASKNHMDEGISLMEKAAKKIHPIIKEVLKRMVQEKKRKIKPKHKQGSNVLLDFKEKNKFNSQEEIELENEVEELLMNDNYGMGSDRKQPEDSDNEFTEKLDMRAVLGYLNQSEWISNINIGNIMQINPFHMDDFLTCNKNEYQLSRTSFLEKISLLAVGYFCASTEIRFILQLNEDPTFKKKDKEPESEYWHAKSLEIACCFLPSDCPLVNHILLSYQKHHSPAQQAISEDKPNDDVLEVVRPLNGIESNKFQPLIRKVKNGEVIMTPADISPAYKMTKNLVKSYKNSLMNYISGESHEKSDKRDRSSSHKKHNKHSNSNILPVEEAYNNFADVRNSQSAISTYESKNTKVIIDNLLNNKNTIIEILSNKGSQEEKQNLLKRILEEVDTHRKLDVEHKSLRDQNNPSSGMLDHVKSMGVGEESHDSLLCDDEIPSKNLKDKAAGHHSFHKRPLSQNNVLRSKSSRQKRRKKTPGHDKKAQNTLISNSGNTNSKATREATDTDPHKSRKLIDDSKFGANKSVVNASCRPKSSRGNRSFDSCNTGKNFKGKRHSIAGVSKTSTNFGKKKNSYG